MVLLIRPKINFVYITLALAIYVIVMSVLSSKVFKLWMSHPLCHLLVSNCETIIYGFVQCNNLYGLFVDSFCL